MGTPDDRESTVPRRHLLGGGGAHLGDEARAGSKDAFAAIVHRHERALRGYAAKLLRGTGQDPEDVVQDVFIRAHAALTSGDQRELALKPWLFRMTRNRVIDVLRRGGRTDLSLDAEHAAEPVAAPTSDPAHAFGRREGLRAMLGDLAELPEQQRDALLMRELEGLSHDAVAAQLGVTPQATRQLVFRARDNLVKTAAARDATCLDIRDDLAAAHDARHRPTEHARRHVRGCTACKSYHRQLHDVRRQVALIHPGPAILGLLGLAKLGGTAAFAGGSKTAALLATATVAVTAGAAGVIVTQHRTLGAGEPAPRIVPGSSNIFDQKIVKGGRLPADTALVDATLRLPPVKRSTTTRMRLTCPRGYLGIAMVPREGDGRDPAFRGAGLVDPDQYDRSRFIDLVVRWRQTTPPHTVTVTTGLLCERPPLRKRRSIDPLAPPP